MRIFFLIQRKPWPFLSSCPIVCFLGEEINSQLMTASFQALVERDKVPPEPPFLQTEQPQLPQPLLTVFVLQTLHHLHCPSLDTPQHFNVFEVLLTYSNKQGRILKNMENEKARREKRKEGRGEERRRKGNEKEKRSNTLLSECEP